jgi:nanoRNase/pAp phosphatase (c-di-AMP/oligoRNAs hydrolase)
MSRLNATFINSQPEGKNMKNYNVSDIKNLISTAKTALIVVPQMNVDSIGAALGLAIALKKSGKEAKVYCPTKTDQNYSKLSGLELLTDVISSSDLTVSLDYPLDQIEQVSYNDDGGRLNLIVKTKSGAPKVESNKINIDNDGGNADVCFMLGDELSLGNNTSITNKGNWIFISPTNVTKAWAKATLVDPDAPFSEIFTFLLPMIGLELDIDSGKNLLIGLRVATQSFSVNVSPETFEAGAVCLKATQPEADGVATSPEPMPIENVEKSAGMPLTNTSVPNPTFNPTV